MDIRAYNRTAWDGQVDQGNEWTVPVSPETIAAARSGQWEIVLTPTKAVPAHWFPDLAGLEVLCLASGGGQQGPVLAAAGAHVTVYDNSPKQLGRDRMVAEREGLAITTIEGDMRDLAALADESFGLVVHPVSNLFVPDIRPVWREAFRVLRPGGVLISGFINPVAYIFDRDQEDDHGLLQVRHAVPYSDLDSVTPEERQRYMDQGWPLEFGHTLDDQIGGQVAAGFVIDGFYEDIAPERVLTRYLPIFIATRAVKLPGSTAHRP